MDLNCINSEEYGEEMKEAVIKDKRRNIKRSV